MRILSLYKHMEYNKRLFVYMALNNEAPYVHMPSLKLFLL